MRVFLSGLQAEEFLERVCQAVAAELDGALCNMQLLFGVNTVARAEFQRILQELLHWGPLVEVRPFLSGRMPSPCCRSRGHRLTSALLEADTISLQ